MGRIAWLALVCGCSYSAPTPVQTPDTPGQLDPDASPDSMTVDPDGRPDAPLPPPTTSDFVASADTWIDSVAPNTSFANDTSLLTDGGPPAVTLIRFDLSGLPTITEVISAELHVFTTTDPGAGVTVFPVLEAWSETTATWNTRASGQPWTVAGANPPSRGTVVIAEFTPDLANTEFPSAFDAATVQGWVASPAANLGIAITSVNADGPKFRTRLSLQGKPFLRVVHRP